MWIESHQELGRHPKTKRLARALQISIPAAVGHLMFFWWWATDYAQSGNLDDFTDEDIADAAMWEGDAHNFVDALISARFIDRDSESTQIHDWYEYAGRLIEQREKNRKRAKDERDKRKNKNTQTVHVPCANDTQTVHVPCRATEPNRTNITEHTNTPPYPPVNGEGGAGDFEAPAAESEKEPECLRDEHFEDFWRQYPKKVGKEAARKAWKKAKPNAELRTRISEALARASPSEQWRRENGRYIPNPATWLNQGRWDDELTPGGGVSNAITGFNPEGMAGFHNALDRFSDIE